MSAPNHNNIDSKTSYKQQEMVKNHILKHNNKILGILLRLQLSKQVAAIYPPYPLLQLLKKDVFLTAIIV